ncbi:SDR family NAD(P)-dependent oxidoreductase [Billgrantia diversa]|uniref:SDR family oxidoreductase n=1 Tax=Halomonas sp. MCCC 1A13316 TaxID=2733487 RepID=UPI0018A590C9|nr:SDR family oxidoreductase [Halomonas sp. MCCC 1A13316]QOR40073.1 SDR family NAD(P)-dependent oxidoreductase [Halomonas sp. MCCC 1A13316]
MAVSLKKVADQTLVITGATSGIGLSTTRLAADRGARLIVVARDENALEALVDELDQRGAAAVAVAADVGDPEQVREVVETAIHQFGGFDTWINNAGVSLFGYMTDQPLEDQRRLFDTDYWGVVHGSLEAARHLGMRAERHGGAIINLGSVVSDRAIPLQGMYSAAKHAVKGFTDALRMELEDMGAPVSVTLVKPGSIATPFPHHAGNHMDVEPTLPPPLYEPSVVAEAILHCAEHPRRDIRVGGASKGIAMLGHLAPRLADRIMRRSMIPKQRSDQPPRHIGGLHRPAPGVWQRADFDTSVASRSRYTQASMHPALTASAIAGAVLGIAALTGTARRKRY